MSLICRVLISYFDAHAACLQPPSAPTRPIDEEEIACLQAARDEAFGFQRRLSNHVTREGVLCIEDGVVRPDTYKAAALAHGLFRMSVIDHAHRCVLFPTENKPRLEREQLLRLYQSHLPNLTEQQHQQRADETLRAMLEQQEF